ncbi:VanZ family protein [Solibacillus sp. FSL W7-1464]|uniref:VanZ family protein n=1 Tax=unclassified Solibacillus TaxID=2637870 RepID=UPI0030F61EBC
MKQVNLRKTTIVLLTIYTALILYFLYVGFNRGVLGTDSSLRYNLIPGGIALHYPMGKAFSIWFFEYGNFLAFIPFGVVIPLLFRCSFKRFIIGFVVSITLLETIQMLTHLGAFDINDIMINTLAAAVGFAAQRIVKDNRDSLKGIFKIVLVSIVLALGTIIIVGGMNQYLEKGQGETVALNDLIQEDGSIQWDENLSTFTVGQNEVTPHINLIDRENTKANEFVYLLNGQYKYMTGYVAIPDDVLNASSTENIEMEFISGGDLIYSVGLSATSGENGVESFEVPLNEVNALTIKVNSEDANPITYALIWDVTLTEENAGQKVINRIKGKIKSLF